MKSSELIINPDGSVYHLSLLPGEVANTIITVGDQDRVEAISKHFDSIEVKKQNREFVTHTGYIGAKRLTVISTGIGTDNIDIVFNEIHSLFNIDFKTGANLEHTSLNFVRLGTSGTLRKEIPIGTILASRGALGLDGLLHFYENNLSEVEVDNLLSQNSELKNIPKPYYAEAEGELLELFKSVYDIDGVTITAPGFYAPQGRAVNAPVKVKGFLEIMAKNKINGCSITNLEMETAGIYGLSKLFGHKALSMSAILANRISGEFSKNPEETIDRMIQSSLEKIIELR